MYGEVDPMFILYKSSLPMSNSLYRDMEDGSFVMFDRKQVCSSPPAERKIVSVTDMATESIAVQKV